MDPSETIVTEQATSKPTFFNPTSFVVSEEAEHQLRMGENKAGLPEPAKACIR